MPIIYKDVLFDISSENAVIFQNNLRIIVDVDQGCMLKLKIALWHEFIDSRCTFSYRTGKLVSVPMKDILEDYVSSALYIEA